jgi:hypothetical protein
LLNLISFTNNRFGVFASVLDSLFFGRLNTLLGLHTYSLKSLLGFCRASSLPGKLKCLCAPVAYSGRLLAATAFFNLPSRAFRFNRWRAMGNGNFNVFLLI